MYKQNANPCKMSRESYLHANTIRSIVDGIHSPRLDNLIEVLRILGMELKLEKKNEKNRNS